VILNRYSVNYLTFNIIFQRNDLVYLRPYSERQVKLHRIIKKLKEKRHMSLKSIADKLNALRIKTHRGNTFSSGSIHSILKRKKERDKWIEEVHNKEFPIQILNFDLS
jgi:DNA-binding transcriptional MerR regulator